MSQSINRRWINIVLIAALLISLMPTGLLAQSLPPTVDPTAKSAAEVYGQFDGDIHTAQDLAAKTAQKSPQSAQPGVTAAQALAKLHPGLRTVAQSAAPALPAVDGMQATAVQEPILVQVALRVQANPSAKETVPDLSAYFVDGKVYARPAFGKGEFKVQMFFGQIYPQNVIKLAYLAAVEAILPLSVEQDGQPMDMPIDDVTAAPAPGPAQWAALRGQAESLRADSPDWSQAQAYGDGKDLLLPADWFEVQPDGPHKASVAWARGFRGEGVAVAVLDDGTDFAHPDLMGTQRIYSSTVASQYNGWPMVFSPFSQFIYALDQSLGSSYIASGQPGIGFADTSAMPVVSACGVGISCFNFTPLIDYATLGLAHTFVISNTMSKSGVVHAGAHPDLNLRDYVWGEKAALLVTDPNVAGVYDTVYVDLDMDYDFRDEKPLTKADVNNLAKTKNNMVAYRDMNGDGVADISGGLLYYIADGVNPPPAADWLWDARCGTDAFMCPGKGNLVAFTGGSLGGGYSHGTQCASNIVGQGVSNSFLQEFADLGGAEMSGGKPTGAVYGMAPGADFVDISNIYWNYASSTLDGYLFAAVGYDAIDQTGFSLYDGPGYDDTDGIQITSNSYGSSEVDNDGWDYPGQVVTQLQLESAPYLQFLFSTGNGAPAYGTTAPPSPWGGISVGASTEYGSTGWDSITNTLQIMSNDVTPFSNRGPGARGTSGVDVVAGGAYAAGAQAINYYVGPTWGVLDGNLAWSSWGGTSRSAPIAAGVMALIYQAYKTQHDTWPDFLTAKALLKSTATDLNYDIFTQGAGSVNADVGTAVASGLAGISMAAGDDEWNPGDFRGDEFPGFAHLVYAGETWERSFAVDNHGPAPVTVAVKPVALKRIKTATIDYTITPAMIAAESVYGAQNRDNFFKAFNFFVPITATAGMDPTWYNVAVPADADLMIVRQVMPNEDFDVGGNYTWDNRLFLSVYNWQDINGDGNVWEDKNGNGVVNFINDPSTYGTQADGAVELVWDDPRTELDRWEFGRFSYNRPTGNRSEMWVHNPAARMIDGLFIGGRHLFTSIGARQEVNLTWRIDFYKEEAAGWLTAKESTLVVPAGGSAVFTGTVTVPADQAPGMVEAAFNIVETAGVTPNTVVVPVSMAVAATFSDGLQLGGMDQYTADIDNPYNNAAVRGLQDWGWRAESGDWRFFFVDVQTESVTPLVEENFDGSFPPLGWQAIARAGQPWRQTAVRAMSGSSAFHGDDVTAQDAWLVTPPFAVMPQTFLRFMQNQNFANLYTYHGIYLSVGSSNPADGDFVEIAELGPGSEDLWMPISIALGDYAGQTVTLAFVYQGNYSDEWYIDDLFIGGVTTVYAPGTQILVKNEWNDPAPTDNDTLILGPTPTNLTDPTPGFFGPYVLDTVGSSPNANAGGGLWLYDTSSGGSEDWVSAPLQDGLHAFLQHNVLFSGSQIDVVFTNTLGTLQSAPSLLQTESYLDQGIAGVVTGQISLDVNGIVAAAVGPFGPQTLANVPLPFVSPNVYEWTYPVTTQGALYLEITTSSVTISDIDLGIFYCGPTGAEGCSLRGSSASATADERVFINQPQDGVWVVAINNWSGPAGTFNVQILAAQGDGFSLTGVPQGAVSANTPFSFTVGYDAPMTPGVDYGGLVVYGIPESPALISLPITVTRLSGSAALDKSVSHATVFEEMEIDYTLDLYNLSDPNATFSFTDPLPTGVDFVDLTFSFAAPLGECFAENFEGASFPPPGWVVTNTVGAEGWNTNSRWGRGNDTPGSGLAAAADSDAYDLDMDTELHTPAIDLTGSTVAELTFASNFQDYIGAGDGWVDLSSDGGLTWSTVYTQTEDDTGGVGGGGVMRTLDLSAYAGRRIHLRFRYAAPGDAWYWQVDDVRVGGDDPTCTRITYPDFVYDSGTNTVSYEGPLPISGDQPVRAWFEGFEHGVPPAEWILVQTNPNWTWLADSFNFFEGGFGASVLYDANLLDQDETLMTPQMMLQDLGANTLTFQTAGSPYWCRDDFDNCDLEVWAVVGGSLGGEDDILLGLADAFWTDAFVWSPASFDLAAAGVPVDLPVAFAFRYVGNDGAQVMLDAVELLAVGRAPSATATITARVNGDVSADATITNTASLGAEHLLRWGAQTETPVSAWASSHVGAPALGASSLAAPATSFLGDAIVYRIHLINGGDALAEGVTVTGTLPSGATFAGLDTSPPNQSFSYNSAQRLVQWTGNLAPGEHRILTYVVNPASSATLGTLLTVSGGVSYNGYSVPLAATTLLVGEYSIYLPVLVTP